MGALTQGRWRKAGWAALALTVVFEGWKSHHYFAPNAWNNLVAEYFPPGDDPEIFTVREHQDLLYWLAVNTNPDDPILASIGFSPVILAYANRPIIIHSMFDDKTMRDKVQAYTLSLFGPEQGFYEFAHANGAKYFIYEAKTLFSRGPDSQSYIAGYINAPKQSAAFLFQFQPQELKHFHLVYQNTAYRVFAVDHRPTPYPILAQPVYTERALTEGPAITQFLRTARDYMLTGFQAAGAGDTAAAIRYWTELKRLAPYTIDINAQLCLAYLITGDANQARELCNEQMRLQPHSPTGHFHQALLLEKSGRPEEAQRELRKALAIDPRMKKASDRLDLSP